MYINPLLPPVKEQVAESVRRLVLDCYTRISEDPNELGHGVGRQEEDERAYAERQGNIDIRIVRSDNDMTAFQRNVKRPGFEKLLADLANEVIDGALFYMADRMARQPVDLERLITICEEQQRKKRPLFIRFVGTPEIDINTDHGKMILRMLVNVARDQSAAASRRVSRQKLAMADQGKSAGGSRAFGWTWATAQVMDRQGVMRTRRVSESINEAEAEAVRWAADQVLADVPLNKIAGQLNVRKIRTPRGNHWQRRTLRAMLMSPRLAGIRVHQGEPHFKDGKVVHGDWTPILDQDLWLAVYNKLLTAPEARNRAEGQRKYLLAGILVCTVCQTPMTGNARKDPKRGGNTFFYRCEAPPVEGRRHVTTISGPTTDAIVLQLLRAHLTQQVAPVMVAPPEWKGLGRLLEIESKIAELMTEYNRPGGLDGTVVFPQVAELREEAKALEAERDQLAADIAVATRKPTVLSLAALADADPEQQRRHIEREIETVWVRPATQRMGPKFDVSRLFVEWVQDEDEDGETVEELRTTA